MDKAAIAALKAIILEAGKMSLSLRAVGLSVEKKSDGSMVTNADKILSEFIFTNLSKLDKNFPVICEERANKEVLGADSFWLVDPIDGTRGFINNHKYYTINIALIQGGRALYGFLYAPAVGKLYYTDENGAFAVEHEGILHGRKDKVDAASYIALVGSNHVGSKVRDYLSAYPIEDIISVPSSIKLAMIAAGDADIYPRFGHTMEWDIAAGHAILSSVGGDVVDLGGKSILYGKQGFCNSYFIALSPDMRLSYKSRK